MLSEKSHAQKATYYMIPHFNEKSRIGKSPETESRLIGAEGMESDCYWIWGLFLGDEHVLKLIVVIVTQFHEHPKNHRISAL